MRCRLTLLLTTVAIGGCAVAASISVQRQLTPVPAADCLPRALKSAPRVAAVGAPDSTGLEYSVRISDTSVMQRHVDLFVGITAIHDSAETIHVRDQWFGSIDANPPAERRERAAAAAALLNYITAQCAPNTHSAIVCTEEGSGTHGGRPCQR
jgi:hypothetical protein